MLFEFEQTIEVKQVVLLPGAKLHVKDLKVFVGMDRPELQSGELFMNDPVCGVYVPPKKAEYMDYFDIDKSFTVKGKFKEYSLKIILSFFSKGQKCCPHGGRGYEERTDFNDVHNTDFRN